jgi:hypothetical protein
MFSRDDLQIESVGDLIEFLPIAIFLALVAPFVIAAYTLGFVMDVTGWLETDS